MAIRGRIRHVAVVWEQVTGYLQAALRAVLADRDTRLLLIQNTSRADTLPRDLREGRCQFLDLSSTHQDDNRWLDELLVFAPDVALITGNRNARYLRAARLVRRQGGIVVWANDRIPRAPLRDLYQTLRGRITRLWRDFHAAFVPGHAAASYARLIGFESRRIFRGLYTCDTALFRPLGVRRHQTENTRWPSAFLFVGQMIERKGVDLLTEAYAQYRQEVAHPWDLWCVGQGPLRSVFDGRDGVRTMGSLRPEECAQAMAQAGALVLPSRWDHWGVVIHEAVCAGLPVVASRSCGASIELVQDGYNGFTFVAGDVSGLRRALVACSQAERPPHLGANSLRMSYRFDPELFAWQLLENIPSAVRSWQ